MEYALIENIQRVDLNPVEEAEGYLLLKDKYGYNQNKISENIGKSRSEIANKMRLLNLPVIVLDGLRNNNISYAHARTLIGVNNKALLIKLYNKIIKSNLNVRQIEKLVKNYNSKNKPRIKHSSISLFKYENKLNNKLNTHIKIKTSNDKFEGQIAIKFNSKKDLDRLINLIIEEW